MRLCIIEKKTASSSYPRICGYIESGTTAVRRIGGKGGVVSIFLGSEGARIMWGGQLSLCFWQMNVGPEFS